MSTTTPSPEPDGGPADHDAVTGAARRSALPVTGHPAIDAALASLSLGDDVDTHHDALAAVLDTVQQALNTTSQPPLPRR